MPLLIRKRQIAAVVESTPGTWETDLQTPATVVANDYANNNLVDPSWSPTVVSSDRNIRHPFLTPVGKFFPNIASAELTFSLEMGGHVDNDDTADYVEPPCGPYLRACGFESGAVQALTVTMPYTTNAVFRHGENVTGDAAGDGTVIGTYLSADSGTQVVYVLPTTPVTTDFAAAEVMTGGTTGSVETVDSVETFYRQAFWPDSDDADIATLSIAYYVDGKRLDIKGCRGNVTFQFTHAERLLANFTFTGIIQSYADGASLVGANTPTIQHSIPPACLGTGLVLNDQTSTNPASTGFWSPTYNEMSIDMQNNVILREDSQDADGWSYATISTREPQITLNPDEALDTVHPIYDNIRAGVGYAADFSIGSTTGNTWTFNCPGVQWEDPSEADREEVTTWDLTGMLTGGTDSSTNTPGGDNEVVLINS